MGVARTPVDLVIYPSKQVDLSRSITIEARETDKCPAPVIGSGSVLVGTGYNAADCATFAEVWAENDFVFVGYCVS